jgi:hypothetical protein
MRHRRKVIDVRGASRRDFIRLSTYVGAALGLRPWRIFQHLDDHAGEALASEAACSTTNRSVHLVAGTGGFAWFQLLWPHVDVAQAANASFAYHAPGAGRLLAGTDKPLYLSPQAPWAAYGAAKAVTAMMAGTNETHTAAPVSSSTVSQGTGLFAACAALQSAQPTLVPVIGVNQAGTALPFGAAAGAPSVATVADTDGMVGLFNSVAASAMGTLSDAKDARNFEAYFKALVGLSPLARRSTMATPLLTGKTAANLLGLNLASQLSPTADDLTAYGVTSGSPSNLQALAKGLITTAKAFKLGLTNCVLLPAMNDDPHGAFTDMAGLVERVTTLGKILDGFMADLMGVDDPTCAGRKLGDNLVVTVHGDTPKTPLDRNVWPDATPGNSNWVYAMGGGLLKTGWFGGVKRDGTVATWNPDTGADLSTGSSADTAAAACGAILFAVAKGDARRISDFFRGSTLAGVTRLQQM